MTVVFFDIALIHAALNADRVPFFQVLAAVFCGSRPTDDVDEIDIMYPFVVFFVRIVVGESESAHRQTRVHDREFGIAYEVSLYDNKIEIFHASPFAL
jgi:hypothetical protein